MPQHGTTHEVVYCWRPYPLIFTLDTHSSPPGSPLLNRKIAKMDEAGSVVGGMLDASRKFKAHRAKYKAKPKSYGQEWVHSVATRRQLVMLMLGDGNHPVLKPINVNRGGISGRVLALLEDNSGW